LEELITIFERFSATSSQQNRTDQFELARPVCLAMWLSSPHENRLVFLSYSEADTREKTKTFDIDSWCLDVTSINTKKIEIVSWCLDVTSVNTKKFEIVS